jgi:hypothetical protein
MENDLLSDSLSRDVLTGPTAKTGAPSILDPERDDITSPTSRLAAAATRVFVMLCGLTKVPCQVQMCLGSGQLADMKKLAASLPGLEVCPPTYPLHFPGYQEGDCKCC